MILKNLIPVTLLTIAALALFAVPSHSAPKTALLFLPLTVAEKNVLTPEDNFATNASEWLFSGLSHTGEFNLNKGTSEFPASGEKISDRDSRLGKTAGAGIVLSGYVDIFDGKIMVRVRLTDVTNAKKNYDDQVYTYNVTNSTGLEYAVSNLALRVAQYVRGTEPEPYIEPYEESNITEETILGTNGLAQSEKTKLLRQLSLLSVGYQYPTGFELNFIEASYNWLHPDLRFGIGLGSCLVRMLLSFPGYTNATGTILPVQLSIPLWTNPDKDRVTDLLFRTEWAWYTPLTISGTTTNTNSSFFLDNPVNYLDFRLSFYFTRFFDVNAGCMWLYRNTGPGSVYFYAGGTIFLGFYTKE